MDLKPLLLILVLANLTACDKKSCSEEGKHEALTFINNSNRTLDYKVINNYPDTIAPDRSNAKIDQDNPILPHSTFVSIFDTPRGIECVEDSYKDMGTAWLYFFDKDTLDALDWETIRTTGRGILERRVFDLEYLKRNDFKIVYEE